MRPETQLSIAPAGWAAATMATITNARIAFLKPVTPPPTGERLSLVRHSACRYDVSKSFHGVGPQGGSPRKRECFLSRRNRTSDRGDRVSSTRRNRRIESMADRLLSGEAVLHVMGWVAG
jgi:hypothetical protein